MPRALDKGKTLGQPVPYRALAVVASAWTMLAAQGCGAPPAYHSRDVGPLRVATYRPTGSAPVAQIDGVLAGRVNPDGTACFYFDKGDSHQVAIIWPAGASAFAGPLRVSDGRGHTARVGDHVTFGGGVSGDSGRAPVLGCGKPRVAVIVYWPY